MPLDHRLRDDLHRLADSIEPDTELRLEQVTRRARSRTRHSSALLAAAAAVVVILFVAVIVPGRRPEVSPGGADRTGGPGPTMPIDGIVGSWSVTLSDADPGVAALSMAGDWTMTLDTGPTIGLTAPAGFVPPSGKAPDAYVHAESGDRFVTTLFARDFAESCTGAGTYTWSTVNQSLSYVTVDDTCDARRILLATRPWSAHGS